MVGRINDLNHKLEYVSEESSRPSKFETCRASLGAIIGSGHVSRHRRRQSSAIPVSPIRYARRDHPYKAALQTLRRRGLRSSGSRHGLLEAACLTSVQTIL